VRRSSVRSATGFGERPVPRPPVRPPHPAVQSTGADSSNRQSQFREWNPVDRTLSALSKKIKLPGGMRSAARAERWLACRAVMDLNRPIIEQNHPQWGSFPSLPSLIPTVRDGKVNPWDRHAHPFHLRQATLSLQPPRLKRKRRAVRQRGLGQPNWPAFHWRHRPQPFTARFGLLVLTIGSVSVSDEFEPGLLRRHHFPRFVSLK
jgi:hypothetical protein